jgi:hypothetical protein
LRQKDSFRSGNRLPSTQSRRGYQRYLNDRIEEGEIVSAVSPFLSSLAPVPFKLLLAVLAPYDRVCASAVALRSVLGPSSVGIDRNGLFYFSH